MTELDPEELLFEQEQGRTLHQKAIDWFTANGVSGLALAQNTWGHLDFLNVDDVVWLPRGTFEFARYKKTEKVSSACTFVVRDQFVEPVDIVAWQATTGRLATWLGRASLIGEDQLLAPRLTEGLPIFEDPLQWLQERRAGVVVLSEIRAAPKLRDAAPLLARSFEHGQRLNEILRVKPPRILVPSSVSTREAA